MFIPTHHLVAESSGEKTPVCLEKSRESGWFWVRTALDWFSGESIIKYHEKKGLHSQGNALQGYSLELIAETNSTVKISHPKESNGKVVELDDQERPYSVREVCKRFGCGDKLLQRMRTSPNFAEWSRSRDPEGMAWEWKQGKYFPVVPVEILS